MSLTLRDVHKSFVKHRTLALEQGHTMSHEWRVVLITSKLSLGVCNYRDRTIAISKCGLKLMSQVDLDLVMAHEVAHAVTAGDRHGSTWKRVCIALGGDGKQFNEDANLRTEPAYVVVHEDTQEVFKWLYRNSKKDYRACKVRGRESETLGKLVVVKFNKRIHEIT